MSPRKERNSAPPPSVADRIGDLPDSVLHHLISFLPAQAAVRTCVLGRRWRNLWMSTTDLRIVGLGNDEHCEFQHLRKFVDHLLLLRDRTDLHTVKIKLSLEDDVQPYVNLWIRFAVMCKVQVLKLEIFDDDIYLDNLPLVSRYLRTLDLDGATLQEAFLDFASCPALENLKMFYCDVDGGRISSRSLKHLTIYSCQSNLDCRVHVSTPGLISLKLVGFLGRTPFFDNMALLENAYVDLGEDCEDVCLSYDSGVFCGADNNTCDGCDPNYDDCTSDCVLLGGVSGSKHLQLISEPGKFIFARDLRHCPTFSKLKNLLLNEYWCEAPDLDPLACILKSSPVLEKLTLQLFSKGPNHKLEMKGSYSSMQYPSTLT